MTQTQEPRSIPVVILAAGQNSRFFPLNSEYHKGFIPLLGKPLVLHQLENLYHQGFRKVIMVVSPRDYTTDAAQELLSQLGLYGLELTVVQQKDPLGMGDALLQAKDLVTDRFAVLFPYHLNAGDILHRMVESGATACVCVTETTQPWLYGVLKIEGDQAVGLVEKPTQGEEPSNLKVQGLYILNRKYLELLHSLPVQEYVFESALDRLMQIETVKIHNIKQALPSLKFPWHLFELLRRLWSSQKSTIHPGATIAPTAVIDDSAGPVFIEAGATVSHASRIVGPTYIGQNAFIGDFSLVRECDIEAEVTIGVHSDITRSIFLPNSTFHGGGFIGDSIIGSSVKIGSGMITANKRFDRKPIHTMIKGKKISCETNALGLVIGHGSGVGVGVRTMPGVLVGARQVLEPGSVVSRNLDHVES